MLGRRRSEPVLLANIDGFREPLLVQLMDMRSTQFIRPGLAVEVPKAERAKDILPRRSAAAVLVSEDAMDMAPEIARRLSSLLDPSGLIVKSALAFVRQDGHHPGLPIF